MQYTLHPQVLVTNWGYISHLLIQNGFHSLLNFREIIDVHSPHMGLPNVNFSIGMLRSQLKEVILVKINVSRYPRLSLSLSDFLDEMH